MTNTSATDTAQPPAANQDPIAVIQSLYAAFARGDLDAVLDHLHPEVDWSIEVEAPGAELVPMFHNGIGRDAALSYFGGVAQMEIHAFEPRTFHRAGDVVIVELVLDFTHRTTGKHLRNDEIHRFVVRDGMIVHYRPYCDTAGFIEAFRP